jgi:prepilin-type N-terminal cleavage/methylation domain-containing protein
MTAVRPPPSRARERAFSLLELMVAVGIMTVIVAALYTVFSATQRALRANVSQTDVTEGGRFAMALLAEDLRRLTASGASRETNLLYGLSPAINAPLLSELKPAELTERYYTNRPPPDFTGYQPVVQALDVGNARRVNVLQELFIHSRSGVRAAGVAYRVINARSGVGSLARYHFEHTNRFVTPGLLSAACLLQPAANFSPILDGVIHFRVQAYDPLGFPMSWTNGYWYVNAATNLQASHGYQLGWDLVLEQDPRRSSETFTVFRSNALPAALELELGILEPDALARFRALPAGSDFAARFLSNRASQVQLFRQRIPIWQAPPLSTASSVRP